MEAREKVQKGNRCVEKDDFEEEWKRGRKRWQANTGQEKKKRSKMKPRTCVAPDTSADVGADGPGTCG